MKLTAMGSILKMLREQGQSDVADALSTVHSGAQFATTDIWATDFVSAQQNIDEMRAALDIIESRMRLKVSA